jgi:hypothetical protein
MEKSDYNTMSNENLKRNAPKMDQREVNIKDILLIFDRYYRYLFSKWLIIIAIGCLGACIGLAYSWSKKPIYTASTTFVLENAESASSLGQYAGLASMVGIDVGSGGGGIFQGDNIVELYRSRTMLKKTLLTNVVIDGKKQLLIDRYIEANKLKEHWKENPVLKDLQFSADTIFTRIQDSIITDITREINKSYLSVGKPDKKLSIIKVDVKGNDEVFVKVFNDQIVKNVNDFYVQTKIRKLSENISILQLQTDSVRRQLNANIYSAAMIADETPNLNPTRQQQRIVPTQKSQVSSETNRSILAELVKNLELSKMSLLKETPLIQIIDEPVYPLEIQRIGKLKGLIAGGLLAVILLVTVLLVRKAFRELTR